MAEVKKRVALLSNITVDLIAVKLNKKYEFYLPAGFDTWLQEALNPESGLYSGCFDAVVVLLDGTESRTWRNTEEGTERILLWKRALMDVTDKITSIPIFVSTIDIRENRIKSLSERKIKYEIENDWYQFLQGLAETKKNVFTIDLADVIAEIGRRQFYSNKMWYMSSMPYSRDGLSAVSTEIDRVLNSAFTARKKIIVLDLDNTLWGGVIGEDGIDGIELSNHKEGQRYFDFQRQLLEMKNRGIVLALNSKNNLEEAETCIQKHPAMLLRLEDFISRKINWKNKATNLKTIENETNLTEGSFIFIDDNPVEREIVKGECPDVVVPDFPTDTTELLSFAESIWVDYCRPLRVLTEDLKKTEMYRNEIKRKLEMRDSFDLDDYITKMKMNINIHRMRQEEVERVVQLCNKTNQFNVTTKRYTRAEIEAMALAPNNVIYVVYCSDKYGDSGLIGVIILKNSKENVRIDTFLMSCRVMGRKIENVIINELAAKYTGKLIGEFIPTEKNVPVKDIFERLDFSLVSNDAGHKIYELDTSEYVKKDFRIYNTIKFEE